MTNENAVKTASLVRVYKLPDRGITVPINADRVETEINEVIGETEDDGYSLTSLTVMGFALVILTFQKEVA